MLPEYETAGKDRGNTALKWSKAEVVERAVAHINTLEAAAAGRGTDKKNKGGGGTRKENEWLREAIRTELELTVSREDMKAMTLDQIKQSIARKKSESATSGSVRADGAEGGGLGSDVFVASIGVADDHCYSMRTRPDLDLVAHEEEVGAVIEEDRPQDQEHSVQIPQVATNAESQGKEGSTSSIEPRQPSARSNPIVTRAPAASATVVQPSSVITTPLVVQGGSSGGFAFIPAMPFFLPAAAAAGQLVIRPRLPPANKLPLPRLGAGSNLRTVSVLGTTPKTSIIMPPKPKRKRRKRKKVEEEEEGGSDHDKSKRRKEQQESEQEQEKQAVENQVEEIVEEVVEDRPDESAKEIDSTPSGQIFTFSDLTKVDSILPDAILASEDPMVEEEEEEVEEELVETIDLTTEDDHHHQQEGDVSERAKTSETKSDSKAVKEVEKPTKRASTGKEKKSALGAGGRSRKSKSSYSIAALCQISVNIGAAGSGGSGNPAAAVGVADSPGVLSLAEGSVGTVSPTETPVPAGSPLPQQQQPAQQQHHTEQQSNQALALAVASPTVDELESLSPSKSFLTSFPLVSSSSSSTAKPAAIDTVEEQALETLDAEIKKLNKAADKDTLKKTVPDLSVFDFTDGRPDSPTVPSVPPTSALTGKKASRQSVAPLTSAVTAKVVETKAIPDRPKDVTISTKQSQQHVNKTIQRAETQQTSKSTAPDKRAVQDNRRVEKPNYSTPVTLSSSAPHGSSSSSSSSCNPTLPPLTHHYDAGYRASNSTMGYHHHYYPSLTAASVMSPSHFQHQGSAAGPQTSNFADLAPPPPPTAPHGSYHASVHHTHPHGGGGSRYHNQASSAYPTGVGHHHSSSAIQATQDYLHSVPGDPAARHSSSYYSTSSSRHYQYSNESNLAYTGGQPSSADVTIKSGADRKNR